MTQDDFFCIAFSLDDNRELTQATRATPTLLVRVPNATGLREGEGRWGRNHCTVLPQRI